MPNEIQLIETLSPIYTVTQYTDMQITKIWLCTAVILIALAVSCYFVYKWFSARYTKYLQDKEIQHALDCGMPVPVFDDIPTTGTAKKIMLIIGVVVVIVGIIQYAI